MGLSFLGLRFPTFGRGLSFLGLRFPTFFKGLRFLGLRFPTFGKGSFSGSSFSNFFQGS